MTVAAGTDAGAGGTKEGGGDPSLFSGGTKPGSQGEGNKGGTKSGDSSASTSWRDSLPDDLKNDPSLAAFTDTAALAKSFISTKAMVGADKIVKPGKHATDKDWTEFYQAIGKPTDLEKYEVKGGEGANADLVKAFKAVAFEKNLLPAQAQAVVDWFNKTTGDQKAAAEGEYKKALQDGYKGLRQEYGEAFDREMKLAEIAATEFLDESDREFLTKNGLDKHPNVLRIFARLGHSLAEDKLPQGDPRFGGKSPGEIQGQINTIMGNPKDPYHVADHPNHAQAVKDMQGLFTALTQSSAG